MSMAGSVVSLSALHSSRARRAAIAAAAFLALAGSAGVAAATPFRLDYLISDVGGGEYQYDFTLTLDDNDTSWAATQGFRWFVFGDCGNACSSPLTAFDGIATDPPWTSFGNTTGSNNGPTLLPTGTFYTPTIVGEAVSWSGTSTAILAPGALLWSNLASQNGGVNAALEVAVRLAPDCGNGTIDAGEQCDDSNLINGDCCSAACQFEGNDVSCDDGNACTLDDACNGAGACAAGPAAVCDDSDPCSTDSCDTGTGCVYDYTPLTGCFTGAVSQIQLNYSNLLHAKDKVKWKLKNGSLVTQADLGNPSSTRMYGLCLYDVVADVPTHVASIVVAPGPLWISKSPKGFNYKNKTGGATGVTKAQLKTGIEGKSSAALIAKGVAVSMPVPEGTRYFSLASTVRAQLVNNEDSTCWTSDFSNPTKNDAGAYKAKSETP
jgi:cysteine-rich repeat protein